MNIWPEVAADHDAIGHISWLAFGQDDEARLVDALRDCGYVRVSLPGRRQRRAGLAVPAVAGTIPFSVVGVLASLTSHLAEAGISVFAVSTFDTDYLLVKDDDFEKAITTLAHAEHSLTI